MLERLATSIAAVRRDHPVRVAIDGVDGAGKTILADELAPRLAALGRQVIRASVDSFLRPRAERYRRAPDSPEGYYLDSHDLSAVRDALLRPLGPGGDRHYRVATFDEHRDTAIDSPVEAAAVEGILLFDGIFAQRPELAECFEYRIFVAVDPAEAARRERQRAQASGAPVEQAMTRYQRRYEPGQRLYLNSVHPELSADAVVENSDPQAPKLTFRASG